jgi:hypothetical protein
MAKFLLKWILDCDEEEIEINEEILKKLGYIHHYVTDFPYLRCMAPKM